MKTRVTSMSAQSNKWRGGSIMSLRERKPEAIPSLVGRPARNAGLPVINRQKKIRDHDIGGTGILPVIF